MADQVLMIFVLLMILVVGVALRGTMVTRGTRFAMTGCLLLLVVAIVFFSVLTLRGNI